MSYVERVIQGGRGRAETRELRALLTATRGVFGVYLDVCAQWEREPERPELRARLALTWMAQGLYLAATALYEAEGEDAYGNARLVEQAVRFAEQVEPWLGRAELTGEGSAPEPGVMGGLGLPALLPHEVEDAGLADATTRAAKALAAHAESLLGVLGIAAREHRDVEGVLKRAEAWLLAATLAEEGSHAKLELAWDAMELYYYLGQVACLPVLLSAPQLAPMSRAEARTRWREEARARSLAPRAQQESTGPTLSEEELWSLTSERTRERWKRVAGAERELRAWWEREGDPKRALRIAREVSAALTLGMIEFSRDEQGFEVPGHPQCPWSGVYTARRGLVLDGVQAGPGTSFSLARGKSGRLEAVLGPFAPEVFAPGHWGSEKPGEYLERTTPA